ncbi:MAG TPA: methyl-accepting chemotaxis protein [Negativicutes bacterium]
MNSIRTKLAVTVITLFFVALSILAGLNYWQAKKILQQDVENEMAAVAQTRGEKIGMWLENRKTELTAIARSPIMNSKNREAILSYIISEMNNNKIYENIFWTDDKGNYIDTHGVAGSSVNRPYFQPAINGNTFISDPIISPVTGKLVVVVATPIWGEGRVTGLLVGAINIEEVEKLVLEIKVGQTGYAYLLRSDGTIIIHPDQELMNKANISNDPKATADLKEAVGKMIKGETGIASYAYGGVNKYLAYAPVLGTSWSIGVNVPISEAIAKLNAFTWIALVTIIAVLILASLVIFLTADRIAKPLKILEGAASRIAGGDLSVTKINVHSKDELGRLTYAFETMVNNLRGLVREIDGSAEQVAASSEELTANAEQSAQAANQVAISITGTAQGVDRQVDALKTVLGLVEKITAGTREEAAKTQDAVGIASKAVGAADEGNKAVDTAISQMTSIRQTVDNSAKVVAELGERSKEIGQIVETISGIAGQTNLLALNAAIEAARAGEQGRGFAVVAEEVRKLAEQSQEAAKQIAALISDIRGKTDEAVSAMAEGTQEVRRGTEVVDQAGRAFKDIDGHIQEVAGISQKTADGLIKLADASQQVLDGMRQTEQISHEISDQSQTISAATEEQSASMEEIASSSQHLAQLAAQLQLAVAKFKI